MKRVYITKAYQPPSSIHSKLLRVEEAPEDPSLESQFPWLQRRIHRDPEPFDFFYVGQLFYEARMIAHACTLLQEYVAGEGVESIGWHLLGHCFFRLSEMESAEYCFKKSCGSGKYDGDWQYLVECRQCQLDIVQSNKQYILKQEQDQVNATSPQKEILLEREHDRLKNKDEVLPETYVHHTSEGVPYSVHQTATNNGKFETWSSTASNHRAKIGKPTFAQWTLPREEARRYIPGNNQILINAYSYPQLCTLANSVSSISRVGDVRHSLLYDKRGVSVVSGLEIRNEVPEAWIG